MEGLVHGGAYVRNFTVSHMGGDINSLPVFEAVGMELARLAPMLAK